MTTWFDDLDKRTAHCVFCVLWTVDVGMQKQLVLNNCAGFWHGRMHGTRGIQNPSPKRLLSNTLDDKHVIQSSTSSTV